MSSRWTLSFFFLLPIVVVGCRAPSSTSVADVAPVPSSSSSNSTTTAKPETPAAHCEVEGTPETLDDEQGQRSEWGYSALENIRVHASANKTVVTWERQSRQVVGDSSREPVSAIREAGSSSFQITTFPVHAYACATYGLIAPASFDKDETIVWGRENTHGLEIWNRTPKRDRASVAQSKPQRTVFPKNQEISTFVASGKVALAAVTEGTCEHLCACPEGWKRSLWLHGLDPAAPFAQRVVTAPSTSPSTTTDDNAPSVPALSMNESGGVAAYRLNKALYALMLDAQGKPVWSKPLLIDSGDVGAPAVSILSTKDAAVMVWAKRESKEKPYELRFARLANTLTATPESRVLVSSSVSSIAPATLATDDTLVVAWMEGPDERSGNIHVARTSPGWNLWFQTSATKDPLIKESTVVSTSAESNARDPELSGSVDAPVIAWSSFSNKRPGGEARLARLRCGGHSLTLTH
jgi:hypothetical protein